MCNSTHVAAAVLAQFEALAKTGKPQPHEYTVLAGIALTLPPPGQQPRPPAPFQQQPAMPKEQPVPAVPIVVALATGTKCLPASKRDPSGRALNDCHAEVCCRRALLRWLYCEMLEVVRLYRSGVQDGTAVLQLQRCKQQQQQEPPAAAPDEMTGGAAGTDKTEAQEGAIAGPAAAGLGARLLGQVPRLPGWQFALRPGVQLHMFVSQPPCGDASIFPGVCAAHGSSASGDACAGSAPLYGGRKQPQQDQAQENQQQPVGLAGSAVETAAAASGQEAAGTRHGPAQPGRQLGRTGAKPLKRAKVSHAQWRTSSKGDLLPARHAVPAGESTQRDAAAVTAVAAAGRALAVPQAHEVETYGEAQPVGLVRRKPGRGEATLSLSCSDKLARWRLLGLQGSLLSGLLSAPLHLASITVAVTTPSPAGHSGGSTSGSPPAAEAAVQPPCPAAIGVVVAAALVEAAAKTALRRALVDRMQPLVAHLPERFKQAVLPLDVRVVCSGALADAVPEPQGSSTVGAAGPAEQQAPSPPPQPFLASKQEGQSAPGRSHVSAGAGVALRLERLAQLGLAPGGPRKVAGGSTLLWHAPPSTHFLAKGGLKAVTCGALGQVQDRQQQQQQQQEHGCSKGCKAGPDLPVPATLPLGVEAPWTNLYTVKGGTQEAVAGTTGLKLGVARKGAAVPPPAAASFVCKESLARLFLEVVGELKSLPQDQGDDVAAGLSRGSTHTIAAGPAAAGAGGGKFHVVASAAGAPPGGEELQELHRQHWEGRSYRQLKQRAGAEYHQAWKCLLAAPDSVFEAWIPKPADLEDFAVA